MASVVITFRWPIVPSNNVVSWTAMLAVSFMASVALAQTGDGFISLCTPEERVQFSCHVETKMVSLCATGGPGALTSLTYRYGAEGKIEKEFVARKDNLNRFFASYSVAGRGAYVTQVWFNWYDVRYLLTECGGGNCPQDAGLAVLRGNKVLMDRKCPLYGKGDHPGFAPELIHLIDVDDPTLGVTQHLHSTTELLRVDESYSNEVEKIYRVKPGPNW